MFSNKDIAQFADLETPFYYYDLSLLQRSLNACADAAKVYDFHVHYAMKANFNDTLLKRIKEAGLGADCVSGNEVKKAIEIGFDKKQVVFAGVGKSDKEINEALDLDIFCFNVESVQELEVINELAGKKGKVAKVAIRINPNVDAHTHHNITTGLDENKFGVNSWDLPDCADALKASPNLEFMGIHFHIGSQITNLDVYKNLCVRINEFAKWFEERGFMVRVLNVGGGLGIDYQNPEQQIPDFTAYFKIFNDFLERRSNQEVHFELGRAIVGQCSSLISRVLYVKNGKNKNFIVLDAGMTELMRPALYQAYHQIENLSKQDGEATVKYDVVGPICESTDCFGKEVLLQETKRGDLIGIRSTGAYGEVMSSHYNLRENVRVAFNEVP
ncbi:diaminopimelate decarboxylase [Pedobacter cryoconitis]|uniref:Diaminopimelate decarboxylase n=1 Tax=Pedobacter cryoconitis TaxID=188932 RepID=A0A7W9DXI8_9SPHI|nr:diaminopimelate decarboxylase [Pedobacter cryoconitis]MBB5634941.1 diaminopimelate decarboxylase [Pedobacter cryoconitis]MBB6271926.1 diaminopimelate decarboxylase [Pedobacter cryoconitis]